MYLEELQEELSNINEEYKLDDSYYIFEERGTELELLVTNNGTCYIEDPTVRVRIPDMDGIYVADDVYSKPLRSDYPIPGHPGEIRPILGPRYPRLTLEDGIWYWNPAPEISSTIW